MAESIYFTYLAWRAAHVLDYNPPNIQSAVFAHPSPASDHQTMPTRKECHAMNLLRAFEVYYMFFLAYF